MILEKVFCNFRPGLQIDYELFNIVERDVIPFTLNGGIPSRPTKLS